MAASLAAGIAGTVISTVGTIVSANDAAAATRAEGKQAQQIGNWQNAQARQAAGQERASAQRQAENERRAGRLAVSTALARSAASGGGAADPTVLKIYGDLAAEGEYNAQTALFEGEESARDLEMQGGAAAYEGAAANEASRFKSSAYKRAGYLSAAGNVLSMGSDFYSKYAPADSPAFAGATLKPGYSDGTYGRTRANFG
jgi:hypothetical protein